MRGSRVLAVACLLALATPLWAEGPVIDHSAVACMVAEKFPQLEARIVEPETISRARVQFRGERGPWYFVEMKRSGGVFTGLLPKPKKSLKTIRYYIEATDRQFRVNRTQEFAASVVPEPMMCADKKMMAGVAAAPASLIVGGPSGAAAVPAGFSSSGVVAAPAATAAGASAGAAGGGGIGTAAVVGIVAGGAAIAGVAVAAGGGGNDATPTTTVAVVVTPTTTTTTLAPAPPPTTLTPCPGCYAGNWQGQATLTAVGNPPLCGSRSTDIGKTQTFPLVFAADGTITFPDQSCEGCVGHVDAAGAFMIALLGDPPGSGLTCPTGQVTGRCTSTTACAGNGSQGGDLFNFVMTRPAP
jgi:hypothetical protein